VTNTQKLGYEMFMKFDPKTGMFKKQVCQFTIANKFDNHIKIWKLLSMYSDYIRKEITLRSKAKSIVIYLHKLTGIPHNTLHTCVRYCRIKHYSKNDSTLSNYSKPRRRVNL
jgi:hypothetical protein